MNKKILALALAIVFIATAFTACKQELELTKINGKEYPLATDKDGQTIVNEENQVAVLVTDFDCEVITYENGEDQTHWVQLPGAVVVEDAVQDKEYKMNIPEGWSAGANGKLVKDGTDNKCSISFAFISEKSKGETLETYLEGIDGQNAELASAFEAKGYSLTADKSSDSFDGRNHVKYVYKITDDKGQRIHYGENYYFETEDKIYKLTYACDTGNAEDETFDFRGYLVENFKFNG